MMRTAALAAFAGFGIELEYMIVDRHTLDVRPIADRLLGDAAEVRQGRFAWSNELVLHLVELKNAEPAESLAGLAAGFQAEIARIDALLAGYDARLMPTAMHPWMDPLHETRLWPHAHAAIYRAYDRIFDCRAHGWANIQSMHLNLPFAGDAEFARLHAGARLLLPILPALAASSPAAGGQVRDALDFRMACYRDHPSRVPALIGEVIPDNADSAEEYAAMVLAPMYLAIAPLDREGVLRHEWLNARGAIPRFDRSALEIRVIDIQECPAADIAIAALASAAAKALYDGQWSSLAAQRAIPTAALADILHACISDADAAIISDAAYLAALGCTQKRCTAGELWHRLRAACAASPLLQGVDMAPIEVILRQGPLARRILRALGPHGGRERLADVYRELCDCLAHGRMFSGSEA